jgi:hypothetical protein
MRPGELTLDQMLADPIVRLVMLRDGVEEAEIRALFRGIRHRRANASSPSSAPRSERRRRPAPAT